MGLNICCEKRFAKTEIYSLAPPNEREISPIRFTSPNDSFFEDIETKYNVFTYIQLVEFLNLLENYSIETATLTFTGKMRTDFSKNDQFLSATMNVDEFQSFLENKIFKTSEINALSENNEEMLSRFKTAFIEIFGSLELKLNQHYSQNNGETITKKTLIPIGVIFCISSIVGKIKLIFDLYKNDNNMFVKSDDFDKYLISSFLICSYCMISSRRKVSNSHSNVPKMNNSDMIKCLKVSELKDSQNLVKVFNETFFDKEELSWSEFRDKFEDKENSFQWILSPKGIRKKLEEHNV